jgi:hypothetical protein
VARVEEEMKEYDVIVVGALGSEGPASGTDQLILRRT